MFLHIRKYAFLSKNTLFSLIMWGQKILIFFYEICYEASIDINKDDITPPVINFIKFFFYDFCKKRHFLPKIANFRVEVGVEDIVRNRSNFHTIIFS